MRNTLKNTGKKLCSLTAAVILLAPAVSAEGPPMEVQTSLSRTEVTAGERVTLTVKIENESRSISPVKIPEIEGLDISYTGISSSVRIVNMDVWRGIEIRFTVVPVEPGEYTIPPIKFEGEKHTYISEEKTLSVSEKSASQPSPEGKAAIAARVELSSDAIYAGEPVLVRYYIVYRGVQFQFAGFSEPPLPRGFVYREIDENLPEVEIEIDGEKLMRRHIATFAASTLSPGKKPVGGGKGELRVRVGDSIFQPMHRRTADFVSPEINVKPLPEKDKPADFDGAVGNFDMEIDYPEKTGDMEDLLIKVKINGRGNFFSLSNPRVGKPGNGYTILKEEGDTVIKVKGDTLSGTREFRYTLIPEKTGDIDPGKISLSFFNPYSEKYERITSDPIIINTGVRAPEEKDKHNKETHPENKKLTDRGDVLLTLMIGAAAACALGAAAVLFIFIYGKGFLQQITGLSLRRENQTDQTAPAESPVNFHDRLKVCYDSNDYEGFLKTAEVIINSSRDIPSEEREASELKKLIYEMRYAGAAADRDRINIIYRVLNKGVRASK